MDFGFWINLKDALYETLRVACFPEGVRGLALSVRVASRREAMPQALRCAISNLKSKINMRNPGLEPGSLAALEPESSASAIPPVPLAIVFIDNFLLLRNFLPLSSENTTLP